MAWAKRAVEYHDGPPCHTALIGRPIELTHYPNPWLVSLHSSQPHVQSSRSRTGTPLTSNRTSGSTPCSRARSAMVASAAHSPTISEPRRIAAAIADEIGLTAPGVAGGPLTSPVPALVGRPLIKAVRLRVPAIISLAMISRCRPERGTIFSR